MSRAPKQPIIYQNKLKLSPEITRFATPKEPAIYRAEKLSCKTLVEIGAGIGGQTIAFSKTCDKVIAIEINKKDAKILNENLKKLQIENVELIVSDALDDKIIEWIKKQKPEIVFCDSARKPEGERLVKDIEPNLKELLKKYSKITKKIAIEVPPFTQDLETLEENFEKEFISLNKQLNRLTLYFNELKENEISVIELPSKEKIIKEEKLKIKEEKSPKGFSYIYEVSPAITLAKLEKEIAKKFDLGLIKINSKIFYLSKEKKSSEFLTRYNIKSIVKNNFEEILKELKEKKVGKVILKYKISPEDYWKERKKYEEKIKGDNEIYLFLNDKEAIICEK